MRLLNLILALLGAKAPPPKDAKPAPPEPEVPAPETAPENLAAPLPYVVMPSISPGQRTLRLGSKGEDVRHLQRVLGVTDDGVFGPKTAGALALWQEDHGLLADGIAGPATWRAMSVSTITAPAVFIIPPSSGLLVQKVDVVLRAMPNTLEPSAWAAVLAPDMEEAAITTPARIIPYLANVHHETGGLRRLVENLSYSAEGMMRVWPGRFPTIEHTKGLVHNPQALAERVYGGRMGNTKPGDGWAARGRGGYQTTGMNNYRDLSSVTGESLELLISEESPLLTRVGASRSASIFWRRAGMNALADAGESERIRVRGNGGTHGLAEVLKLERLGRAALGGDGA